MARKVKIVVAKDLFDATVGCAASTAIRVSSVLSRKEKERAKERRVKVARDGKAQGKARDRGARLGMLEMDTGRHGILRGINNNGLRRQTLLKVLVQFGTLARYLCSCLQSGMT